MQQVYVRIRSDGNQMISIRGEVLEIGWLRASYLVRETHVCDTDRKLCFFFFVPDAGCGVDFVLCPFIFFLCFVYFCRCF